MGGIRAVLHNTLRLVGKTEYKETYEYFTSDGSYVPVVILYRGASWVWLIGNELQSEEFSSSKAALNNLVEFLDADLLE